MISYKLLALLLVFIGLVFFYIGFLTCALLTKYADKKDTWR